MQFSLTVFIVRRDSGDVLELLTMLVDDESSDSEAEEELEMLYIHSAFGSTKEKGERFNIETCDEDDFEKLFR